MYVYWCILSIFIHLMSNEALEARIELYFCPISLEIMKDPHVTKYGHCFEKSSIIDWVKKTGTCPLTKKELSLDDVCSCKMILFQM